MNLTLPGELRSWLAREAPLQGRSQSDLIRIALEQYRERRKP
jgi:hypothetical protein